MTVLIAGAGIGGLTLALSLHQVGVDVRVFEAVRTLKPLGVGINLQPHAVRELQELGLLERLDAIALRTAEVAYFSTHGKLIWTEPRGMSAGYRWPQFSIHRGRLQMMLYNVARQRLGPDRIVTGRKVQDWRETADGVVIDLAGETDGDAAEQVSGALFVAADGIHSTARAKLFPDEGPPVWAGVMMWRGVTRGPSFLTGRSMAMAGCKARKFVCYPIGDDEDGRRIINWIADLGFPAAYQWRREDWNRPGHASDLMPKFGDWHFDWLDVAAVIENASQIFEYPMVDRDPLPKWTVGRMTLLGDAAHPMYPIGSNGASQAILDARVLTREILDKGLTAAALEAYDQERRPATAKIVMANRGDGPDKILDVVERRAPDGFEQLEDVISREELERTARTYKELAGFDVDALNARPPIVNVP